MKIVFVQPNVGFKGHTWEALGIGYLSAYLKKNFSGKLDIDFFSGFYDSDETIIDGAKDADIIGFSCTSPQFKHGLSLAKRIKNSKNHIVFGGIHASVLPDIVIREDCIDSIVIGEGEKPVLSLVQDISNGTSIVKKRYEASWVADLDEIPFPDRKTIKNERNIVQAFKDGGRRITSMLASRGCPFNCSFCSSRNVWQQQTRARTTENLIQEMELLIRDWKIDFLKFSDDTFTVNKQRTIDFCEQKIKRGITLPFGANAHINTMDEELISILAKSGCEELWYGVESGSPRILKDIHKSTNVQRIKKVFKITREYGIKTRAYFLLGMPNETIEDIKLTEELCDELQPDTVGFTLLAPFPTNEHFDFNTMTEWDWSTFDEYSNDWVRTKTLSNSELKQIQKRLVDKYKDTATFRQRK